MVSEATIHLMNISTYSQRYLPVIASEMRRPVKDPPDYSKYFTQISTLLKQLITVSSTTAAGIMAVESTRYLGVNKGKFEEKMGSLLGQTFKDFQDIIKQKPSESIASNLASKKPSNVSIASTDIAEKYGTDTYWDIVSKKGNIDSFKAEEERIWGKMSSKRASSTTSSTAQTFAERENEIWGKDTDKILSSTYMAQRAGMMQNVDDPDRIWGKEKTAVTKTAGTAKGGGILSMVGKEFGSLATSMTKTALVMQPIQQFLGGFMEPFSLIGEMFGAYGEILGTSLYPVVIQIVELMAKGLPYVAMAADYLGPVLKFFFDFLTPLGLLVNFGEQLTSGVSLDQALANIGDTLLNIGPMIANWFGSIDWGVLGSQLATTVITFLTTTDWGAIGSSVLTWVYTFIGSLLSALNSAVVSLGSFATEFVKGIWDAIVNAWKGWFK